MRSNCNVVNGSKIINNAPRFVDEYVVNPGGDNINAGATPSVTLNATAVVPGYGEGTWILGTGGGDIAPDQIHNPNAVVTNLVNGTSTFKWRVENKGCVVEDEVEITYGNITAAEAGIHVYDLCGDTYSLSANGPFNGIGQWSVIYGSGQFDDVSNPKTKVRGFHLFIAWQKER